MDDHSEHAFEFVRTFDANCAEVFAAFLDRDALLAWWAPKGWSTPHVELDARVGGRYRFGMRHVDDPAMMYIHGEYLVIDPPHELRFTYIWEAGGAGERWREFALIDVPTVVTIRFRAVGTATEVFLRQEGFPTSSGAEQHRLGWSSNWDCLAEYLALDANEPNTRD
jgi:uncharacterized protein YndB with AHSA1/START domain